MADVLPPAPDAGQLPCGALAEARDRLRALGFHDDGVGSELDIAANQRDAARLPMVLAALHDLGDAKALLTRVFAYGDTASAVELEAAVGATTIEVLTTCGLLRRTASDEVEPAGSGGRVEPAGSGGRVEPAGSGGRVECPVQLRPVAGLLVASDRPGMPGEAVMPPGPGTSDLARALPRPPLGRVLDLGTGSGVLGLVAAGSGATVTATDINERACAFARFNAELNDLEIDVRAGDLFTPVEGERFDLVVSQPPFVVQPPDIQATTYLHGGPRGDEVALRILSGIDGVLAPGGCAVVRFDGPGTQADLVARVRACVPDGLDVAVFGFRTAGSGVVALGYAVLADPTMGPRYRQEVTSYSRHLAALGLDHFTGTLTVVHRPAEEGQPAVTVSAAGRSAPRWPYVTARLAATRLAAAPDGALLSAWLSPLPGGRLTAELALDDVATPPSYAVRYPSDAVPADVELDEAGAALMQQLVGGQRLASVVEAVARAGATSPDEAAPEILRFAREALRRGLLVPAVTA